MTAEQVGINCPRFQAQESICVRLTEQTNAARTIAEKATAALELINAVQELLDCDEYDEQDTDCQYCHRFSALRKKTAALVLKVGTIAEQLGSPGM
ncbi:MAG: hypothetical protein ABIK79_00470 [Chloroflexota bacterium]|nr:hypothetical protein [Anaerolineae bacterium]